MEKIISEGKDSELVLEKIIEENSLNKDDILYKVKSEKKGLFKSEVFEVTVYKKKDILDLVKDFLKELIINLGIEEINFEITTKDERPTITMYSSNNNILIGHNGNTLKSLENIVKQKINLETGLFFPISLDVENYKDKKKSKIERLAKSLARDVIRTQTEIKMENMNAYERRIVHNILTNNKKVITKSEGTDPNRHVIISPASKE